MTTTDYIRRLVLAKGLPLLFVGCMAIPAAQAETVAGTVRTLTGSVEISRSGKAIPAQVGTELMPGDVLRTSSNSSVGLMLKDDSRISLGSDTHMTIERFSFNSSTHQGGMLVSVVKGTLSMISGLLVKANPGQATIKTPTATVGIRGTEFIVDVP